MKRLFKFFMIGAVSAALLSTTSCSKTCDPGYEGNDCKTLANAKFLGTYSGNFEHQNLLMDVALQGQKLMVQFRDPVSGQLKELFPQGCESKVGDLQLIWINRDKQPTGWSMAFDSGRCYAEGNSVTFSIQKKNNQAYP